MKTRSGRPGDRIEHLDRRPGGLEGGDEAVELRAVARSSVGMHLLVHVRVDLVDDVEVVGRADQEPPAPAERAHLTPAGRPGSARQDFSISEEPVREPLQARP